MVLRDGLAIGVAALATAALGAFFIFPAVYPTHTPLGYLPGQILSYEVSVTKLGGTRGIFAVRLDRGETVRVKAEDTLVPGDRVCVRAVQRGDLIQGFLVPAARCNIP